MYASNVFAVDKLDIVCFIQNKQDNGASEILAIIVYEFLMDLIGTITTLWCYILTIRKIKQLQLALLDDRVIHSKRLLIYPVALLIMFLPSNVNTLLKLYFKIEERGILKYIPILITHSMGLINALIYGYQRKVHKVPPRWLSKPRMKAGSELQESLSWEDVRQRL